MSCDSVYKVIFQSQNQVFELYARSVSAADIFGFLQIEELIFGERSQLVVDPGEEKLKTEFSGVKRSYVPIHAVLRIDQVQKEGIAKISEASGTGKVSYLTPPFPKGPQPRDR